MTAPDQDWIDDQMLDDDDLDDGSECGRWMNGSLSRHCSKAGTEECDWICPIGPPRHRPRKRTAPLLDIMEGDA